MSRYTRFTSIVSAIVLMLGIAILSDSAQALAQRHRSSHRAPRDDNYSGRDSGRDNYRRDNVPRGTQMKVRLETEIDSNEARNGDRFRAVVLNPNSFADATIEGHVSRVEKSGKVRGQTVLTLALDRINFRNGGSQPLRGEVTKIYGEDDVKEVDSEGNIKSGSRGSSTAKRSVAGGAGGAILGAIIGGGKGAAIGAAVGAGAGAGSNVIRGSNRIKLEKGTEMMVQTR